MDRLVDSSYIVAIIPARGGSKSIPRKNVKTLGGVPLIAYSIAAGLESTFTHRVIVSTEDEEIASISRHWGADVPFLRPSELAEDHVTDFPVFEHAVEWLAENDRVPDVLIQLRPTSPFRPPNCLDEAITKLLKDEEADSVRGVTPSGQNPYKMWRIENEAMSPLIESEYREPYNMPRQKLPSTYWQTGHIEVIRARTILEKKSLTGDRILPYVIDPQYAVDLDNLHQWQFAEHLISDQSLYVIRPQNDPNAILKTVELVVFDFDGVITDDRVWVNERGEESVACSREDGMGIALLRKTGMPMAVLSTEENPVVSTRCNKLNLPCFQGIRDKSEAIQKISEQYKIPLDRIAFVGNDVNDIPAMKRVGLPVAVANAHPSLKEIARLVLLNYGGNGAIREFCKKLIQVKSGGTHA